MVTDRKPLPLPETLFRSMKDSKIYSKCDMRSAFMQLVIAPSSRPATRFWASGFTPDGKPTGDIKLYQFSRLPYGIKNSVAIFQRVMEAELELAGLSHCTQVFVDDVLIHSKTMEEHILHVAAVLDAFYKVGLRLHSSKSVFVTDKVEYLGHMVTPVGLEPIAAKVSAMAQLPAPKNKDELRSALGLLNYYRCYIPNASVIAQPLNALLRKDVPFDWGPEQQTAFDTLKAELCTPGKVLRQAKEDRPFVLHTDWSVSGMGAVLGQLDDQGNEFMVACASRNLNKHERQYEVWKGELLAAVWGMKLFRIYLLGREFEICADHRPLLWLLTSDNPTGQQARWVLSLQEFSFTIRHRPGITNQNADVASRFPQPSTVDVTGSRLDSEADGYTGPLPKVVFGPVGTGTPVQPYRLTEIASVITSTTAVLFNLELDSVNTMAPATFVTCLANLAVLTSAHYNRYVYHLCEIRATLDDVSSSSLMENWELPAISGADPPPEVGAAVDRIQQELLRRRATAWVQQAVHASGMAVPGSGGGQAPPLALEFMKWVQVAQA